MPTPITPSQFQQEKTGIILRISSGITFAIMGALIKYLVHIVPLGQLVFFRSAFALVPLMIFMVWQKNFPSALKTTTPKGHFIRCTLGTLAMFSAFATLRFLPIAEATAISYLSPIILVILATFTLNETISIRRWWGVLLGFFGLLVITVPNFSTHINTKTLLGIGLGVTTAFLIASALLQVRRLTVKGEKIATITFYFAISSTLVSLLTLSGWVAPNLTQWLVLIGIGLIGGVSQLLMTLSFSYASASALATYEYLGILWALLIGLFFFNETPSVFFWLAAPLILAGAFAAKPRKVAKK